MDEIVDLVAEPTRQILILSERKVLLEALEAGMGRRLPAVKVGYYIGGMKEEALNKSATEAQVLLAT